jgi:hypothetical protein
MNPLQVTTATRPAAELAPSRANYDRRRISELPVGPNHNVDKLALSVAGVNPFQNGQNTVIMPNATVGLSEISPPNVSRVRSAFHRQVELGGGIL